MKINLFLFFGSLVCLTALSSWNSKQVISVFAEEGPIECYDECPGPNYPVTCTDHGRVNDCSDIPTCSKQEDFEQSESGTCGPPPQPE